jgi:transposase
MAYWQNAPCEREQLVLFASRLEDRIPDDHVVRLLDEILVSADWSAWEAKYDGRRGQPPIHPRVLAGVLLYGLIRRIRSSRQLEYALGNNIDFIWLAEGRSIDHTTLAIFRTRFKTQLKDLYTHVCKTAMALGLLKLAEVAIDGTRVLADSNRYKTLTAAKIEALLTTLEAELDRALADAELADAEDALLFEEDESFDKLPPDVADLKSRQARLKEMLAEAQAADKARRRRGTDTQKNPAQIPATDPDSRVLPNKEGGYAPNYTPMAATDVFGGFIVATDVLSTESEQSVLPSMLDDIYECFGEYPATAFGDGVYPTGENLVKMDDCDVELLSPLPGAVADEDNPALRDDPSVPVPAEDHDKLPISKQTKKLDKAAFIYNEEEDRYYCPEGRPLDYEQTKNETYQGQTKSRRVYRSADCSGCPLAGRCRLDTAKKNRSINRDQHTKRRAAHAAKMATDEAKERYKKRFHAAEVPFAILKQIMDIRRFLLRGLDKVKHEWQWAVTAYNLKKLIAGMARLRAEQAATAAKEES